MSRAQRSMKAQVQSMSDRTVYLILTVNSLMVAGAVVSTFVMK
jgi:hypothetical protein